MTNFFLKYKSSISISRKQYPQLSKDQIIKFLANEIKNQNHSTLSITENMVTFSNHPLNFAFTRFSNRWGNFLKGHFELIEKSEYFLITFEGNLKRAYINSLFIPAFILIFIIFYNFQISIIAMLAAVLGWIFISSLRIIIEYISFPIYLKRKQLQIEKL